jgi:hypothetical protein
MEHEETAPASPIALPLPKMNYFSVGRAMNPTRFCLSTFPEGRVEFEEGGQEAAILNSSTIRACGTLLETQRLE